MTGNYYADGVGGILSSAMSDSTGDLYVVNPGRQSVPDIVFGVYEESDPPTVSLLADRDVLKSAFEDFVVGGHAADLVAAETLSVRQTADTPRASLLVSEDLVVSLVEVADRVGGLATTDESFAKAAFDQYATRWREAEQFGLRAPPITRVRETLAEEVGEVAADDFDATLAELPAVRNDGDGLDEVTVALLVAARHGVLLYDLSRWGEEVGLASKATFSRKKNELEDAGVLTTEKVPIDVGRPRLRLRLATDRLRTADIPELTAAVQEATGTVGA